VWADGGKSRFGLGGGIVMLTGPLRHVSALRRCITQTSDHDLRTWSQALFIFVCVSVSLLLKFSRPNSPRRTNCPIFNLSISASKILSLRFAVVCRAAN
jgi:hypothetical protein